MAWTSGGVGLPEAPILKGLNYFRIHTSFCVYYAILEYIWDGKEDELVEKTIL